MAFVCTVAHGEESKPILVELQGQSSAIVRIGFDSDRPIEFRAVATLLGNDDTQLVVFIAAVRADDGVVVAEFYSGRNTTFIRGRDDRERVLNAILGAIRSIVVARAPRTILRETFDERQPKKASRKHRLIEAVIRSCGYVVVGERIEDGIHIWLMARTSAAPIADRRVGA